MPRIPIKLDRANRAARLKKVSYNPKDFYGKEISDAFEDGEDDDDDENDDNSSAYAGVITKTVRQRILKGLREYGLGCNDAFQQSVNKKQGTLTKAVIDEVCVSYIALLSQVFIRSMEEKKKKVILESKNNNSSTDNTSTGPLILPRPLLPQRRRQQQQKQQILKKLL